MTPQRRTSASRRWLVARGAAARLAFQVAFRLALLAALLAALAWPRALDAHEIPQRVALVGYVRAEATKVDLLVRVPLEAMRDVEFPLHADGSLDLVKVRPLLHRAATQWIADYLKLTADGDDLGQLRVTDSRVARPDDRAFESWDGAQDAFRGALLDTVPGLRWQVAFLDVRLEADLPRGARERPHLVLHPALAHLGVRTTSALHIIDDAGTDRVLVYEGNPDDVQLEPRWHDAARRFAAEGFRHILGGIDHLLFVLCLVLPVRRWRSLVVIVTSFTLAHSLTLASAVLGLAPTAGWFPPLVETLIAGSIVWLALENILLPAERLENRWAMAFAFGLVHGFGFSFALGDELQFAGGHLAMALATFNLGVEAGQLLVLALAIPLLRTLTRYVGEARERVVVIVGSVVVAHAAWHWTAERGAALMEHRGQFAWPALDATFALGAMRLALLLSVALALGLTLRHILRTYLRS